VPIYEQKDGKTIRIEQNPEGTKFIIYMEAEVDSKMDQWKAMFLDFNSILFKIMPGCTFNKVLPKSTHDFATSISLFKFPIISERLVINTEYPMVDY
jgi:hypothetical protein